MFPPVHSSSVYQQSSDSRLLGVDRLEAITQYRLVRKRCMLVEAMKYGDGRFRHANLLAASSRPTDRRLSERPVFVSVPLLGSPFARVAIYDPERTRNAASSSVSSYHSQRIMARLATARRYKELHLSPASVPTCSELRRAVPPCFARCEKCM